jgi:serine/threonine protein kinase
MPSIVHVDKENAERSQASKRVSGKAAGLGGSKKRALKDINVQQNESAESKENGKKLSFEIPDYIKNFDFKKRRKTKKEEGSTKKADKPQRKERKLERKDGETSSKKLGQNTPSSHRSSKPKGTLLSGQKTQILSRKGGALRVSATPNASSNTGTLVGDKILTENLHSIQEVSSVCPPSVDKSFPPKVASEKKVAKKQKVADAPIVAASAVPKFAAPMPPPKTSKSGKKSIASKGAKQQTVASGKTADSSSARPRHRAERDRKTENGAKKGHSSRSGSSSVGNFSAVFSSKNLVSVANRKYVRLEQIGRGGSSKVYKVLGPDFKVYALKRVRPLHMNKKTLAIFQNEINLMKRLRGRPNIIELVDSEINVENKCIYMVMEMGDIDLSHLLKKRLEKKTPSPAANDNFLRMTWQQMLEAVHTIHQERIVHSDLKPANFLCVKGILKLIDFGIAKKISDDTVNIHRESQVGTLNYMSPESIMDTESHSGATPFGKKSQHMKLGRSSDIWSLGCILYQMVYGKTPFAHLGMVQKLQAIINPNVKIHYPEYHNQAVIDTIKSCLQYDAKLRPTITGPNGLLSNEFLNPSYSNGAAQKPNPKDHLKKLVSLDDMGNLVDGLLDLGHTLGGGKTERDIKVREKLAHELHQQICRGESFSVDAALESLYSAKKSK